MEIDKIFNDAKDFLPILGVDYIEFYVGNAKQSAYFYKNALGFESEAYSGLETGDNSKVSYVVKQDKIRFVLTSSYVEKSEINDHYTKHGDGVKVVAFLVEDSAKSYEETIKRGAKSYIEPIEISDENESLKEEISLLKNNDEYVEHIARENLGLIKEEEEYINDEPE